MRYLLHILCLIALLSVAGGTARAQAPTTTTLRAGNTPRLSVNDAGTLTMSAENTPVVQVLKMLSLTDNINIVASPEVSGNVSFNLYEVELQTALEAILGVSGYTWYENNGIIYVTTEEGRGNLPASIRDLQTRVFRIEHATPDELLTVIEEFLTPAGKATLSETEETIVVRESAENMELIADLIQHQDTPRRQVMVAARILEITHSDDLTLGVELRKNWWDSDTVDFTRQGTAAGVTYDLQNLNNADSSLLLADLLTGGSGLSWSAIWKDKEMFLQAVADKGDIETLAAPQLLVLDGQEAEMIIGDKLGYKTFSRADDGTTFENVLFLDVGTQLNVTPKIAGDGLIQLTILPKVSTGQIEDGLPLESTSEVQTSMLVQDGYTVVIGGLIDKRKSRSRSQVPILGDIPWIGLLFGRNTWEDRTVELVVMITPYIVQPGNDPLNNWEIRRNYEQSRFLPLDQEKTFADPTSPTQALPMPRGMAPPPDISKPF